MRFHRTMLVLALAAAMPCSPLRGQELPEAGDLIDRIFEAYGGRERLEAVEGIRIEGQLRATGRPGTVRVVRLFSRPGQLRVEVHYPDAPEIRLLDNGRGWRERGAETVPVSGLLLSAMVLQAARADIPWILDAHRDVVRIVGPAPRGDGSLIGLEVALGTSMLIRAYVDPDTHHVVEYLGMLIAGGRQVPFETHYSDFREVDGLLFPFAEESYASGQRTGDTRIERVELNPVVSPEAFRPDR